MADVFVIGNVYQGTATAGAATPSDPHFQICSIVNINASNNLEATFWINQNGERVDSNLGSASYRIRDKAGAAVSGLTQASIAPDVNGYFHITPVSAALIYDLTHYTMEIEIPVDGVERASSIGLVVGE